MVTMVLGATGFLGSATVDALRERRSDVIAIARQPGEFIDARLDLRDIRGLTDLLDTHHPDAIVNCAVRADFGPDALAELYPVNVLLPGVLANWARANEAFLVQPSATLVHGARAERIGPDSPVKTDTDYGRSKWLADQLIQASGCRAAILRFGGIYGGGGPGHLGLNRAITDARRGTPPTVVGNGSAKRSYVHVADGARAILFVLEHQLEDVLYVAGPTRSISDYLQAVCDVFLPGAQVRRKDGPEAADQIVEGSEVLARPLGPREALEAEAVAAASKGGQ